VAKGETDERALSGWIRDNAIPLSR
jgi:hypothetical protein